MPRILALVIAVVALATAAARQPVTSPIYYLTTAPEVRAGAPVSGELTVESGRNFKDGSHLDVLVLRGREGDAVVLRAESEAFDTYLTLYAPGGTLVDWNDDDLQGSGTDATIRATLPMTGTYVVVVSGFGPFDLGAYTVTLELAQTMAPPAPEVALPSTVLGTLAGGGRDTYVLTIDEATVAGIELRSASFDAYLTVQDADGWTMAENDDMVGTTDAGVVVWLDVGVYQVIVSAYDAVGSGPYALTVDRYVRNP
jgi:hypothetical protein